MEALPNHKLLFAGDVVLGSTPEFSAPLTKLMSTAAIRCCNFEAPLKGFGHPIQKTGPLVSQDTQAPEILENLGFNLFSLANNHIYDYGEAGLRETLQVFPKGITMGVGDIQSAYALLVKEIQGIRYGFVAYGENGYGALNGDRAMGHAWVNHPRVNADIKRYKEQVDVLIVQIHAGVELFDLPIPEWKARFKEIIDLGADVIVGHHPHIIQGFEEYQGKMIFYSLGNFYFDYPSSHPQWNTGALLELNFQHKKLKSFEMHVIKKTGNQLALIPRVGAQKLMDELNTKLNSADYELSVNKRAVEEWDKHHIHYYAKPFNGLVGYGVVKILKHIKRCIFNSQVDYHMVWHNMFIESNKWLVERAIKNKFKQP